MTRVEFKAELDKVQSREELALIWKIVAGISKAFPDPSWAECIPAFRDRAQELGLEWKGQQ